MRKILGFRVLCYLDELLIAPRGGRAATEGGCLLVLLRVDYELGLLVIARHATKGIWAKGAREIDHLGFRLS